MENFTTECLPNPGIFNINHDFVYDDFPTTVISIIVCTVILSVLITSTNLVVLIGIARKSLLKIPANILIFSLMLADFLTGFLFLPLAIGYLMRRELQDSCVYFSLTLTVNWLFRCVSYLTLIAVCIERYVSLFWTYKHTVYVTKNVTSTIAALIWLSSLVIVPLSVFRVMPKSGWVMGGTGAVGMVILVATNYRIVKLARRHCAQIQDQTPTEQRKQLAKSRKQSVTITYVIGVTLISYLPLTVLILDVLLRGYTARTTKAYQICDILFTVSSLIDPFIYCWRNREIKRAVQNTLAKLRETLLSRWTAQKNSDRRRNSRGSTRDEGQSRKDKQMNLENRENDGQQDGENEGMNLKRSEELRGGQKGRKQRKKRNNMKEGERKVGEER
ncbi:melanocyte-stimulating hormone receptor-like [Nematostella vectensis]|uniref:melanocyte-stimulating hormone receptor-like n=1 Tax=Nematostella vectensis TaxID=45351 RepID=UPI002077422F|nr:melanocyte-stimulating hormone receptor-like [Nematostella vectensis]